MSEQARAGDAAATPSTKQKIQYTKDNLPLAINMSWCKACNLCIALCPTQVFEPDRDGKPIQARPEACTQCTICWVHCPDFAITSRFK
jgi:2-oxoglutarate ferredoxin oxidoreductase subunit delta